MMFDTAIVGLVLASTHIGADIPEDKPRTSLTPGVYVVDRSGITAGVYHNSVNRTSWQLGYTHKAGGRWAVSAGIVTGYPKDGRDRVLPYVALSYAFGQGHGARVITMPEKTVPVALAYESR